MNVHESAPADAPPIGPVAEALILLLAVLLPFVWAIGGRGFNEPDEGRFLEISREMVATGDYIVPRLNGVPHYAKPPLVYWLTAASLNVFGFNETAVRLVPALAAVIAILALSRTVRRIAGIRAGLLTAGILATMFEFFGLGRTLTTDMLMTMTVVLALSAVIRFEHAKRAGEGRLWRFRAIFWSALALGFLAKGPVPVAVTMLALLGRSIAFCRNADDRGVMRILAPIGRGVKNLRGLGFSWGFLVIASVAAPWFYAVIREDPRLIHFFLVREVVKRTTEGLGREKEFRYFFKVLPVGLLPWTLIAVNGLYRALRGRLAHENARGLCALMASWVIVPFIMFQSSRSKLPSYVLPLLPPFAVLAALRIDDAIARARPMPRWLFPMSALILGGASYWIGTKFLNSAADHASGRYFPILGAGLALVLLAVFLLRRRRTPAPILWTVGLGGAFFAVAHAALTVLAPIEIGLRNNTAFRQIVQELHVEVVGAKIPMRLRPSADEKIEFPPGIRLVTYELKFLAGSFHAFGQRAEYLPIFGDGAGWEMDDDQAISPPRELADLVKLLNESTPTIVLIRPRVKTILEAALGRPLFDVAMAGEFTHGARAVSNIDLRQP